MQLDQHLYFALSALLAIFLAILSDCAQPVLRCTWLSHYRAVARMVAAPLGMQADLRSTATSTTFFCEDLVMKIFLRPFFLFCFFKKSRCLLMAKECILSTGKLPM